MHRTEFIHCKLNLLHVFNMISVAAAASAAKVQIREPRAATPPTERAVDPVRRSAWSAPIGNWPQCDCERTQPGLTRINSDEEITLINSPDSHSDAATSSFILTCNESIRTSRICAMQPLFVLSSWLLMGLTRSGSYSPVTKSPTTKATPWESWPERCQFVISLLVIRYCLWRHAELAWWAMLLKGQKGGGAVRAKLGRSAQYLLLTHVIGQVRYRRGRKGKHKCWKYIVSLSLYIYIYIHI